MKRETLKQPVDHFPAVFISSRNSNTGWWILSFMTRACLGFIQRLAAGP
jgi:hypothetical protein